MFSHTGSFQLILKQHLAVVRVLVVPILNFADPGSKPRHMGYLIRDGCWVQTELDIGAARTEILGQDYMYQDIIKSAGKNRQGAELLENVDILVVRERLTIVLSCCTASILTGGVKTPPSVA